MQSSEKAGYRRTLNQPPPPKNCTNLYLAALLCHRRSAPERLKKRSSVNLFLKVNKIIHKEVWTSCRHFFTRGNDVHFFLVRDLDSKCANLVSGFDFCPQREKCTVDSPLSEKILVQMRETATVFCSVKWYMKRNGALALAPRSRTYSQKFKGLPVGVLLLP